MMGVVSPRDGAKFEAMKVSSEGQKFAPLKISHYTVVTQFLFIWVVILWESGNKIRVGRKQRSPAYQEQDKNIDGVITAFGGKK